MATWAIQNPIFVNLRSDKTKSFKAVYVDTVRGYGDIKMEYTLVSRDVKLNEENHKISIGCIYPALISVPSVTNDL